MSRYKSYDVSKYKPDSSLTSFGARTAHFLDWAAGKFPKSFFPPNIILQAIQGLSRPPRSNAQEIQSVRNGMQIAQKYLLQRHSRTLIYENSLGYRATVDSEDVAVNAVPQRVARFNSSRVRLRASLDLINAKDLPNTEEGRMLKAYIYNVKDATKSLFSPEFERRLLPPPPPRSEDTGTLT